MIPELRSDFLLNPNVHHLNHGSFGACPRPVFEEYQRLQLELERDTVQAFAVRGPEKLAQAREALGAYIGCHADDVVYVTNPSYAFNIIAKSFPLSEGDEILTTDLEYGAMDRTWQYYCRKAGARYVRMPVQLPVADSQTIVDDLFSGLSPRTRAVFISHITSTTALRLPVEAICARAKELGLITMVDSAHVPGHIPLDLRTLGADICTGACHKWMLTPKGSSFLYVKRELQHMFDPLIISWGYESTMPSHSQFIDWHQLQGTRDISAFLATPRAIQYLSDHDWPTVARTCRQAVQAHAHAFAEAAGGMLLAPVTDEFMGQMCSIRIHCTDPMALQRHLYARHRIEIPVMPHGGHTYIRYSINAYNNEADLQVLFAALRQTRAETGLLG
jgi:isopenicillin-N epimerase